MRLKRSNVLPFLISSFVTLTLLCGSALIVYISHARIIQNEKIKALSDLGIIRAELEGALNSRLLLGAGLVSYISVKPDLSLREFLDYSELLVGKDPMIRNISVIKGTTIIYSYPIDTNQKAIGVDLALIPVQRESVLKVIAEQRPVIAAKVDLVQGGVATVSRIPVYTKEGNAKIYWGQISIVIMQDVLFREARLFDGSCGLQFLLREKNDEQKKEEYLYGKPAVKVKNPVELSVIFPHGTWILSAIPEKGWGHSDTVSLKYGVIVSILSFVIGFLVLVISRSRKRIQQLESILPICASCKKIRDGKGGWNSVETYFSSSSNITFSHSLCPDCVKTLYGKDPWNKK